MVCKISYITEFQRDGGGIQVSIHFDILRVVYTPYHGHMSFPHSCFGSHIYKYLLVYTGSVAVSTNFHPERPSFLSYQGYIFFVSNKFQNEICPALIISNVIPYFRVVSGRQIGIRKTNNLLCLLVFSGQCLLVCICCFGGFLVLFF